MIPELPPQSPEFPVIACKSQEPAPAPVMSMKSQFVTDTDPAVIVLDVPKVSDCINALLVTELPLIVRRPVTV